MEKPTTENNIYEILKKSSCVFFYYPNNKITLVGFEARLARLQGHKPCTVTTYKPCSVKSLALLQQWSLEDF